MRREIVRAAIALCSDSVRKIQSPRTYKSQNSNTPGIRSPWLVTRPSQTAPCLCTPTLLYTRASKQAPCCNKMPVIKVSQITLEELIELVRQRPEICDATHLGVWLESEWVNRYSICTHSPSLFLHTFRTPSARHGDRQSASAHKETQPNAQPHPKMGSLKYSYLHIKYAWGCRADTCHVLCLSYNARPSQVL